MYISLTHMKEEDTPHDEIIVLGAPTLVMVCYVHVNEEVIGARAPRNKSNAHGVTVRKTKNGR